GDLDPRIDAREADLEDGQEFTGFHRLEKDLWVSGAQADSPAIADQLLDDVATGKITGEEDTFSHTDLWDFRANVEGSKAAVAALRPVVQDRDAALLSTVD